MDNTTTQTILSHTTGPDTIWTSTRLGWHWKPATTWYKVAAKYGVTNPDTYMYLHQHINTATGDILESYVAPRDF